MTNPIFYKRITGSSIQGDATTVTEPLGTLVVTNNNELRLHDGTVAGGNLITGGGGGPVFQLTSSTAVVSLASNGTLSVSGGIGISQSITWPGSSAVFEDSGLVLQGATGLAITSPGTTQITAGSAQWNFTNDGSLTVPGEIKSTANTGPVIINSTDGNTTNTWTFGLSGMLSIPGTIRTSPDFKIQLGVPVDISVPISNSGGWDVNQGTNIATTGGSGTGLTVDIVGDVSGYTSSITIHTPGSGYTDGDLITASNGGSYVTFTVTIRQTDWKFSSDGGLRFPNDNTNTQYLAYTGILNDLVDVDTATPTNGDVLQYNSALGLWQHNQLATGSITLKGSWDANTNTPTLTASQVGASAGWEYIVSVAGTQDLGLGSTAFSVGDLVLYDGTNWTLIPGSASVVSFNTRVGAIVLASLDVTTALGFTPYNSTNPSGYITGISGSDVTTALGFTPYNSTNPSGYITSSALSSYATQSYVTGRGYITSSSISVTTAAASDGGALTYTTATGVFTFTPATTYTLTTATASAVGGIKVGSGLAIAGDGTLSATAQALSTATTSTLGGVKIGSGITITGDGTVSLNTGTLMTTAVQTVNAGGYSGNSVYYPAVWQGNNNNPDQLGLVSSFNINASSGLVTAASANITGPLTVKDVRDTVYSIGTQTSGTVTIDPTQGDVQTATLTGNITINGFTNPVSGQTVTLIITQDGVGSRTLTSTMKFAGGYKTLTTSPNAIDMMTISYIGSTYYASLITGFA